MCHIKPRDEIKGIVAATAKSNYTNAHEFTPSKYKVGHASGNRLQRSMPEWVLLFSARALSQILELLPRIAQKALLFVDLLWVVARGACCANGCTKFEIACNNTTIKQCRHLLFPSFSFGRRFSIQIELD